MATIDGYKGIGAYIFINDQAKKWRYYPDGVSTLSGKPKGTPVELSFDNVISCEIEEEDGASQTTIVKSGVGRAIAGGLLFGGVGAIVGAATGNSKVVQSPVVKSLKLTIGLIDAPQKTIVHTLIKEPMEKKSNFYRVLKKVAEDVFEAFQSMAENNPNKPLPPSASQGNVSAADELRKFKVLLDDGIITQGEFDAKKKQLLEL